MDSEKLAIISAKAASEKKAINIKLFNVQSCSDVTDFFLVCSGANDKHVRAISDGIAEAVNYNFNTFPVVVEGYNDGRWVVMDYFDVIVHVFYDEVRDHYMIEEIWEDAIDVEWKKK
jgi:ribosome silencing factor RsfS/YbeB/iojap